MVNGSDCDESDASETSSHLKNEIFLAIVRIQPESGQAPRKESAAHAIPGEAKLQKHLVFVRLRDRMNRRKREQPEPALDVGRKVARAVLSHGMHMATEPNRRETESDSFRQTGLLPLLPERIVCRRTIEELRQLVNVEDSEAATKKMPHRMPACITKRIRGMQCWQTKALDFRDASPFPESLRATCFEAEQRIAESEVQLRRERLIGIKIIAAPPPSGAAHHHRQMVGTFRFSLASAIAERLQRPQCSIRHRGRAIQINVILRAMPWLLVPVPGVREAFQHEKLHAMGLHSGGDFAMRL